MKELLLPISLIGIAALAAWGFVEGQHEKEMEALREKPVEVPLRVVSEGGVQEVRLTESDTQAAGIIVEAIAGSQVPDEAVVWWDGKPFVYVEADASHFRKTEVSIQSFSNGRYTVQTMPAQARIVTTGAQLLISEEQRGLAKVGEVNE